MTEIIAVIDLGKSLAKTIWTILAPKIDKQLLFLEPEIVSLTLEDIANAKRENSDPEKDAWLEFPDGTGEALGFITRNARYRNRRELEKDELKTVHGVSRCLAILGAIAEKAGLNNQKDFENKDFSAAIEGVTEFSVSLSVLLPLSEWSTSKEFKQNLVKALQSGFNFRGKQYRVNIQILEIQPEGWGLLKRRELQLPKQAFRSRRILCLIMGHYNNSLYFYQEGQQIASDCSAGGFHQLVDRVVAETTLDATSVSSHDLIQAIYEIRWNNSQVKALLWQKVKNEANLQHQVNQVIEVTEKVSADCWKSIAQWIDRNLGANRFNIDEVLVSGGASRFYKEEIKDFFLGKDVLWSCQLNQLVGRDFDLPAESSMAYRLADAYGVLTKFLVKQSGLNMERWRKAIAMSIPCYLLTIIPVPYFKKMCPFF
ncbi:hypothetical protein HC931_20420 [Candidatus Gracilibacteria bacterium]|nr:hypothetical protein [Candidatus Gracilibacteria bacterium]